jgi:hypothetical protein
MSDSEQETSESSIATEVTAEVEKDLCDLRADIDCCAFPLLLLLADQRADIAFLKKPLAVWKALSDGERNKCAQLLELQREEVLCLQAYEHQKEKKNAAAASTLAKLRLRLIREHVHMRQTWGATRTFETRLRELYLLREQYIKGKADKLDLTAINNARIFLTLLYDEKPSLTCTDSGGLVISPGENGQVVLQWGTLAVRLAGDGMVKIVRQKDKSKDLVFDRDFHFLMSEVVFSLKV